MITITGALEQANFAPAQVADELNRGGRYFSPGVRTFAYLVPAVFWLFGPLYMIGATGVFVAILLPRIDVRKVVDVHGWKHADLPDRSMIGLHVVGRRNTDPNQPRSVHR